MIHEDDRETISNLVMSYVVDINAKMQTTYLF